VNTGLSWLQFTSLWILVQTKLSELSISDIFRKDEPFDLFLK